MRISQFTRSVTFAATLAGVLAAGLWPVHAPLNEVVWVPNENAISFSGHGVALSTEVFASMKRGSRAFTLDLWVQPARLWTRGTILAFYDATTNQQLAITQDDADLVLRLSDRERNLIRSSKELRLNDIFRRKELFLSVASDGDDVVIYVDGREAVSSKDFLSNQYLSGQIIVGNSAFRDESWPGKVKGIAIYGIELDSEQIAKNYNDWTHLGGPVSGSSGPMVALYLFREGVGSVIHNAVRSGIPLEIPKRFEVVEQLRFESPVSEFNAQPNYWKNALINILGFVPLGFVSALMFAGRWGTKKTILTAVLVGTATSLTIEYGQSYLPTRYSGLTDVVTNTIGVSIGAILCYVAIRIAARELRVGTSLPYPDL